MADEKDYLFLVFYFFIPTRNLIFVIHQTKLIMKKITATILLALITVSVFAQGVYPGDGMEIYGKNNSTNTVNKPLGYYTDKSYTGGFGIITTFGKDELGIMISVSSGLSDIYLV